MNRQVLVLIVAIAVGVFFLKYKNSESDSQPVANTISIETTDLTKDQKSSPPLDKSPTPTPEPSNPRNTAKPVKSLPVGPVVKLEKPSPSPVANSYKGPMSQIPFKIENGWAIAYGDVLLGTVKGPAHIKSGLHRPKKPRLWDSGTIPFGIHADLKDRTRVEAAIRYFNENTAVQFVPYEGQAEDAIFFVPDDKNCASYIGRIGGIQPIMVADKCGQQEMIHELMHALGFVHEHSRTDRDSYLEILWDNIQEEYWPQFAMVPDTLIHEYRGRVFDFDPTSAMLYPPTAFAKETGLVSLRPTKSVKLDPTLVGLSEVDRERVFYLYGQ